jgi:G:T/U-mismatch repair DNA glycosylase
MDNEQFLKQSEEQVASTQKSLQRVKKMIEYTESLFRRFGFACGNDEAMFALPFIQKIASDIALIAKGERDYLEFMGFKEPKGGWPTLHLGVANSEEETAIDRLLAEAQAAPLRPRKEFQTEETSHSISTPTESTHESITKIRSQMDALLANSKASLGTRNVLKKTPAKKTSAEKTQKDDPVAPFSKPSFRSSAESLFTMPSPKPLDTARPEISSSPSLKQDSQPEPVVPLDIQEMFSADEKKSEEEQSITLLKASSRRIHRHALTQALRSKIQNNIPAENSESNGTEAKKSLFRDATAGQQESKFNITTRNFKTETQVVLPQSSPQSLTESLTAGNQEVSNIPSLTAGHPRRFSKIRLIQEGDTFKIQKNAQL